ncbi:glycoside hydrolase family 32 protein [Listeria costaricensis]|uniref:glycoside hydrolase family 32 protein n=1 Tax=Listeria costaricensis TaxID=2026604 RepID=UPI0013C46C5A|nr:glycoside hydrolase family 32 protein [Listeria costaricensis]
MKHAERIEQAQEYFDRQSPNTHHHYADYHLEPLSGWMNDPNGLVFFKDYYHIFYQCYPFAAENGAKYWGHARTKDFCHWEHLPPALAPSEPYDRDGCYSGSAAVMEDCLVLMYTGHVDRAHPKEVQCMAVSTDGIHFEKSPLNPVIAGPPPGVGTDFRDPRLWGERDDWHALVGSQGQNGVGQVLRYASQNGFDWTYQGVFAGGKDEALGFMWECPDYFQMGEQAALILSPEGMNGIRHQSIYISGPNVFPEFQQARMGLIDHGSDFYAPQLLQAPDGRTLLIGWLNLWESSMPTKELGWVGTMTIPREVSLDKAGQLVQRPARELERMRKAVRSAHITGQNDWTILQENFQSGEIQLDILDVRPVELVIFKGEHEETRIRFAREEGMLSVIREKSDSGDRSTVRSPLADTRIRLFLDRSTLEIFANEGKSVLSTRIYPQKTSGQMAIKVPAGDLVAVTWWSFKKILEEEDDEKNAHDWECSY